MGVEFTRIAGDSIMRLFVYASDVTTNFELGVSGSELGAFPIINCQSQFPNLLLATCSLNLKTFVYYCYNILSITPHIPVIFPTTKPVQYRYSNNSQKITFDLLKLAFKFPAVNQHDMLKTTY